VISNRPIFRTSAEEPEGKRYLDDDIGVHGRIILK
jgi:hypothetical protein